MPTIEFFFDLSSPYSYLAHTQLDAIAARTGASLAAKPMVLAAVFKAAGNARPAEVAAKGLNMMRDVPAWARDYGVPFVWCNAFPFNAIKPERLILAADTLPEPKGWALTKALFTAVWGHDRDPLDPAVLVELANGIGLDGAALLAKTEEQAIKDALKANTDDAIARNAYGAPTFFVGDQMFVGNDRLAFVERAAKGERIYVD